MKLLITGDWHIKETYRGREGRLKDFELLRDFLLDVIKTEKPDLMIHLGDVFHTLSPFIRKDVINFGVELFNNLAEHVRIYVLTGNHDKFRGKCYLDFLQSKNVTVVSSPVTMSSHNVRMGFIPHGEEEIIPALAPDVDILFLHADVFGARLSTGKMMEEGVSDITSVRFVFNGHIHLPQKVGNIICVGSPLQQDFSESRQEKRVMIWKDSEIINIDTSHLPQFRVYEFNKKTQFKKFVKTHKENSDNRDYILVRIPHTFDASLLEGEERVFIEYIHERKERKQDEEKPSLTVEEAMDKWIEAQEVSEEDKSELKKLARRVWVECLKSRE